MKRTTAAHAQLINTESANDSLTSAPKYITVNPNRTVSLSKFSFSAFSKLSRSNSHIRIVGLGLKLACSGDSCGEILLKKRFMEFTFEKIPRINLNCKQELYVLRTYLPVFVQDRFDSENFGIPV